MFEPHLSSPSAAHFAGFVVVFAGVLLLGAIVGAIVGKFLKVTGLSIVDHILGALAAFLAVLAVGLAVHKPLSRVPENTLKYVVGLMLTTFGVFWTGEGRGIAWPGGDLALLAFAAVFLLAGVTASALARRPVEEVAQ